MKKAIMVLAILALATAASAEKPNVTDVDTSTRIECGMNYVCWTWDGSFTNDVCDTGGNPVWEYGICSNPEVPTTDCDGNPLGEILGTVLNGDYPNDTGDRAILGSVTIAADCYLLELCHFYDTENSYDGGNVEVNAGGTWYVVDPMGGYPDDQLSDSVNYYAWCVNDEPGFTDGPTGFTRDCWDLSDFMGQSIEIAVTFGSDSSVQYPGWYIASATVGAIVTPTEDGDWSTIKSMY